MHLATRVTKNLEAMACNISSKDNHLQNERATLMNATFSDINATQIEC